jgi:hypothetical protein
VFFANEISKAVILYLNHGSASFPGQNQAALERRFGHNRAKRLAEEVRAILAFAITLGPADTLKKVAAMVGKEVNARYPKLNRKAIRAIEWYCTYNWK